MAKKSRSSATKTISALVLLALAVAACGGAQQPASSPSDQAAPSSPSAAGASPEADSTQKGAPDQPPAAPPQPSQASTPTASGGSSSDSVQAELRNARHDVDTARRDLEASFGDCANVCRALSSLERVTAHFCALASSDSDRGACEDAKARVYKARARIKESCGTCANGAPLDANAPLTTR